MDSEREKAIEARRIITELSRTCRQTVAYLQDISVLDKQKLTRNLQEASRKAERFLAQ